MPWSVLDQGHRPQHRLSLGTAVILVGATVLLLWIPLRSAPASAV
jgi:uncharacterized membrane protein YczE